MADHLQNAHDPSKTPVLQHFWPPQWTSSIFMTFDASITQLIESSHSTLTPIMYSLELTTFSAQTTLSPWYLTLTYTTLLYPTTHTSRPHWITLTYTHVPNYGASPPTFKIILTSDCTWKTIGLNTPWPTLHMQTTLIYSGKQARPSSEDALFLMRPLSKETHSKITKRPAPDCTKLNIPYTRMTLLTIERLGT